MPDKKAKVPPPRVIRGIERLRAGLQRLNRSLVPGDIALLELATGAWMTQMPRLG